MRGDDSSRGVHADSGAGRRRPLWRVLVTVPLCAALLALLPSEAAEASTVTGLTAEVSSAAAGATAVTYVVGFTTSSAGTLAGGSGTITLSTGAGTALPSVACDYTVDDTTTNTATTASSCPNALSLSAGGATAQFTLPAGFSVAAGDAVTVTVDDVTNPGAGSDSISVATSADTTSAAASALTIAAAQPVANASASLSSLVGQETDVTYTIGFDASSTGGLVGGAGTISIAAAAGTVFPSSACSYEVSDKSSGSSATCVDDLQVAQAGNSLTFTLPASVSLAAGDNLNLVVSGVTNPSATTESLTLSTSSDSVAASTESVVLSGTPGISSSVTGAAVALSTTAQSATGVTYTITFQASANGGFAAGQPITVVAPVGTVFDGGNQCDQVDDLTTGQSSTQCNPAAFAGDGSIMTVYSGIPVDPSDQVSITATNVSNPSVTTTSVAISTIADGVYDQSPEVDLSAPLPVNGAAVSESPAVAGASQVTGTVTFTTSVTGALAAGFGQITLQGTPGTQFGTGGNCQFTVTDETTGDSGCATAGSWGASSASSATIDLPSSVSVAAGDTVEVQALGVTNPSGSSLSIAVSTSSDLVTTTATAPLSAATSVSLRTPSLTLSTTAAGAQAVTQKLNFTASAHGALSAGWGTITLTGPAGTQYADVACDYEIDDLSTQSSGCATKVAIANPDGGSTATVTVPLTIRDGDEVTLAVSGVRNAGVGDDSISISTSSDTVAVSTPSVSLVAPGSVTVSAESDVPAVISAAGVTDTVSFTTSATGSLVGGQATITLRGTPGTIFPGAGGCGVSYEYVVYDATRQLSSGCINSAQLSAAGSVVDLDLPTGFNVNAGDSLTVTVVGAVNPPSSSEQLSVATSSDVDPVAGAASALVAGTAVTGPELSVTPSVARAIATDVVTFDATTAIGSTTVQDDGSVTLDATPGTLFPASGCDYTVTDVTTQTSTGCIPTNLPSNAATVGLSLGALSIAPGDEVEIEIVGVVNPPTSSTSITVTTSSDLVPATTPSVSLTSPTSPSEVTLGLSDAGAGTSGVTYTIDFSASADGAMAEGSLVSIAATPGTVLPVDGCDVTVTDETTGHSASCLETSSNAWGYNILELTVPFVVNAGDLLEVVVTNVTNPSTTSVGVRVETASDPAFGVSPAVALTGGSSATSVGSPAVHVGDAVDATAGTDATITWTETTAAPSGELVTIATSPGFTIPGDEGCSDTVTDETTGQSVNLCYGGNGWNGGATGSSGQLFQFLTDLDIGAGDHLTLSIPGVDNATGTESVLLATSADPSFVATPDVVLTAPASVSSPTLAIAGAISGRADATWTVTFSASATGSLQGSQQVTIDAPPGTFLPADINCDITFTDVTTDFSNGNNCLVVYPSWSGEELTVMEPGYFPVNAGDEVQLVIPHVQNPPGSSASVSVWTSADSVPASSNAVALETASPVTDVTASLSTVSDGATAVTGTFGFTTSAVGTLSTNDEITLTAGAGTVFSYSGCYTVTDVTTGHVANCVAGVALAGDGSTATFPAGVAIGPGDHVVVTISQISNPVAGEDGTGAGSESFELSTTPDATPTSSAAVALATPSAPVGVAATLSTSAEGAAGVTVSVTFQASASDGTLESISELTLTGSTGTLWSGDGCEYTVTDETTGHVAQCVQAAYLANDGASATLLLDDGFLINPGDDVEVDAAGTSLPAHATEQLSVATSSDISPASTSVDLTAAESVGSTSVTLSSDAASGVDITYTIGFTTSATGQMADGEGVIELAGPPGLRFPATGCDYTVADLTNTHSVSCVQSLALFDASSEAVFQIPSGFSIGAGDSLTVEVDGVTNPESGSADHISVSTSSDPTPAATPSFALVSASAPSAPRLAISSGVVGGTGVTYSIGFTASATGGLESGVGTVTVVGQAGTDFAGGGSWCATVDDITTQRQSSCTQQAAFSSSGSVITVTSPIAINPGDQVLLSLADVTNPPIASSEPIELRTSSDVVSTALAVPDLSGDAITGSVQAPVSGRVTGLGGVAVEACPSSGACLSGGTTLGDGSFSIAVPPGTYWVQASPPPSGGPGSSSAYQAAEYGPVTLANGASATGVVITLGAESPTPSGATVDGQSGTVPTIYWASAQTITVTGCPDGVADVVLQGTDEQSGATILRTVPLTESPAGSGTYTGTVPPLAPVHGNVTVGSMVYCAPLTGVLPYAGPTSGGTAVTIYGNGFTGATAVHFGSAAATDVQVVSDSEVTAIAPAGTGTVPVTVTTPAGTTASSALAQYTYLSVASVSPDTGNVSGDGTVLITGTGFTSAEQVYFGSTRTLFTVESDTEIIAWVPPQASAGTVDVTVETSGGASTTSSADQFTYSTTAPTPSTPQQIPQPTSTGTPPTCPTSTLSICSAPPMTRVTNAPPLTKGYGGTLPDPAAAMSSISSGATYALTDSDSPPDSSGDWQSFLSSDGNFDWIGNVASIGDNLNSIIDGDAFASDIAEEEDFDGGFGSLSDTLADLISDSALEDSFLDFALGPVGGIALAAFQMYCSSANPQGVLGGACALASVPTDLLGMGLDAATDLLSDLWNEYIDPSGTVVDDKGNPVAGATVTILASSSGTSSGPYVAVPAGSVSIQPTTNPELSTATGQFGWDVLPGWYEIEATKSGCHAPGSPEQADSVTAPFDVPPPEDGLQIVLSCESEATPAAPAVTGLSIASGPASGGTTVSIYGSGFLSSSTVSFGGSPATSVLVVSPTDLEAVAPPGSGTVDVTVSNSAGTSATGTPDQFTYLSAPTVTSLSAHDGTDSGGSTIEIDGSGFDSATGVDFGTTPAINFDVLSNTQLLATSPPGTGTVDVTVSGLGGTSTTSSADRFSYVLPLAIVTATLHSATFSAPYSTTLSASGGVAPYHWKLVSGSLAPGLSFSSSGLIAGTPTKTGTFHLGVEVSDSDTPTETVTVELTLTVAPDTGPGYWLATSKGAVYGFGSAIVHGSQSLAAGSVVGLAATAASSPNVSTGYWLVTAKGVVYAYGDAKVLGHPSSPASPVVGIAAAPRGLGYWLVTAKGVVYAYGTAKSYGEDKKAPSSPVVAIAPNPAGTGYWLVSRSGAVSAFGKARSYGSVKAAAGNVVAIAADSAGTGYWITTSKGVVYAYGSAKSYGEDKKAPSSPVVGVAIAPKGTGYWLVEKDGDVTSFGSAATLGSATKPNASVVGIAAT